MTGDPDLDQTCEDMAGAAARLRQLQGLAAQTGPYSTLTARRHDLADAVEEFAIRGEKLRLHSDRRLAGRALLLVVEEADRLRKRFRRRPTGVQLADAIKVAAASAERDRVEAEAEANLARAAAKAAAYRAAFSVAAVEYLRASR